ncbi:MAG: hypothetical protein FWD14_04545 [Treponema sp.]|nr:hypothetical protein [Treponema sp.]
MKNIFYTLLCILLLFLWSCQKKEQLKAIETPVLSEDIHAHSEKTNNYDWLSEHTWIFRSGHYEPYNHLIFRKLEIPLESDVYQVRLRKEYFYFYYQTKEEREKLFPISSASDTQHFEIEFSDNFSRMRRYWNGYSYSTGNRVGQMENPEYPIVGIWGSLPSLNEYRLVDPVDCVYSMEITEPGIGWGLPGNSIRIGTYLLFQTGERTFETKSSFPDGHFRVEIKYDKEIWLIPLFTLPDEEGYIGSYYIIVRID